MALDFSDVTSITIPEGDVTKIEKEETVLWEKEDEESTILTFSLTSSSTFYLYFQQDVSEGVLVSWGDGVSERLSGVGTVSASHAYSTTGTLKLTLTPDSGCNLILGDGSKAFLTQRPTATTPYEYCVSDIYLGRCSTAAYSIRNFSALKTIEISKKVGSIGDYFLANCTVFNSPLIIPDQITVIPNQFMFSCTTFNSTISLPNMLTVIGDHFMSRCNSLNTEVVIPNSVTTIGAYFLGYCISYAQKMSIPASVTTMHHPEVPTTYEVHYGFMYNAQNFMGPLEINTTATPQKYSFDTSSWVNIDQWDYSLGLDKDTYTAYTNGVAVTGVGASVWKSLLANRSESNPFRNLL